MSVYRIARQGEELVLNALSGSEWSTKNGHDIDWKGIKVSVRTRGISGTVGSTAFTFSHFNDKDSIYVLVGITKEAHYFWVISPKKIKGKKSFYASIKQSVPYPELAERVDSYAKK